MLSNINALDEIRNNLDKISQSLITITKIAKLDLDLELLRDYDSLSCWVGEFSNLQALKNELSKDKNILCVSENNNKKGIAAVFCDNEINDDVQSIISEYNFESIAIPNSSGSASDLVKELNDEKNSLI